MKKITFLLALATLACSFTVSNDRLINKSFSDKDEPFVEKIKQSTLVVVMLEENADYLAKLTKKGKDDMAATYSSSIKTYNDNMQAMVPRYLKISQNVVFKTPSEIAEMSVDERSGYSYLLYDESLNTDSKGPAMFVCDFFNDNPKTVKKNIDDYENFIQFECLNDKKGLNEYRKLDVIAPANKKHQSSGGFQQNLVEIVPTQADLKICLTQLQQTFDYMVKNENVSPSEQRKALTAEAQQNTPAYFDTIKHKTLLICKQDIDKDMSIDFIKKYYPYSYKVVSKQDFDKAILTNDAQYCVLLIMPFVKVPGMYGAPAAVKYFHVIVDAGTEVSLYTGMSGHVMVGPAGMGGYQTITAKNLQQLTHDLDNPGK